MQYDASNLLVHPQAQKGVITRVTPETAGWEHLSFEVHRMSREETWSLDTDGNEYALVILGGVCSVTSNRGSWHEIGRRPDVFSGMPYGLYLPRNTSFTLRAHSDNFEVAVGWTASSEDYEPKLVTPTDSKIEIRGGGTATRQINSIIPPGFACHRIIAVEVYTPGGNWSSYPPHKHDVHRVDDSGKVIEADLEEIYYYKVNRPDGYALQRVYTSDGKIDALMLARNDDTVLVPEGYHPVSAAHGYNVYYLNFLAGSVQSLANMDDPDQAWIKGTWKDTDPRVPVVNHTMEQA
jgi:5-deoxy-glucuronate isomerase